MPSKRCHLVGLLISVTALANVALAAEQVAVLTRAEGDVKLFVDPATVTADQKALPHATFEGATYSVRTAKVGDRLQRNNVIQTGPAGKARFIYRNGDQITVAPGSAFRVTWDAKKEDKPILELFSGKIRTLIQSEGPRTGLKVTTKSAVMGVRGTDFHVAAWSKTGGSELSVLRGKVQVARLPDQAQPAPKAVEVSSGFSAVIKAPPSGPSQTTAKAAPERIDVQQTPREQLVGIQRASKIDKGTGPVEAAIATLEKQAVTTVMQDIKKEDPGLYKTLVAQGAAPTDTDDIQAKTVKKLFLAAPSRKPGVAKPQESDLDSGDIYDKYQWDGAD
ncbi:MAG: FecR family protein [Proteobacteria bacterium]|nr:FecR family protein [Pseudomonadota bacterium]